MAVKKNKVLMLISVIILSLLSSCGSLNIRGVSSTLVKDLPPVDVSRAVVLGFKPAMEAGQKAVFSNPFSGIVSGIEPVKNSAANKLSIMLFNRLKSAKDCELVGPDRTGDLLDSSAFNNPEESEIDVIKKIGKSFSAEAVILGYLQRWKEREGTEYSIEEPASVSFVLYMIDSESGSLLWKGKYDKKQKALSENLLEIGSFIKNKGKWITVEKLAENGLKELVDELPIRNK